MSESAIAECYARAIFEIGHEQGKLKQLSDDFRNFAQTYENSSELQAALTTPGIADDARTNVIRAVSSRLAMCTEALNSVRLLARRRRLPFLPAIAARLETLADEKAGVIRVKVTSAQSLPETYFQQLVKKIEARTGKTAVVERAQDPSLLAGVLTQIGDNTIDGTLKGRLAHYEQRLVAASG